MKQKLLYGAIAVAVGISVFVLGWKASQISRDPLKTSNPSIEVRDNNFSENYASVDWQSLVDFVPDAENFEYEVAELLKNYLVIRVCPGKSAPPDPCRTLLFDLQSRKEIKTQFPSSMGSFVISDDEKYVAFVGIGRVSQPGVSIELIDDKKVYCLLSEDDVADVKIKNGAISFRELLLGDLDDSVWTKMSFDIESFCQEKIHRGEGYEFSYPHRFSVSESDDQIVFGGRSSEFSISLSEGRLETEFLYPPSGEMIQLKEIPIGSVIWYEFSPGDGGGGSGQIYKIQLEGKILEVSFPQFRKGWSDGGVMDDTKYQNAIFDDMISQEAILSGFHFF